MEPAVKVAFLTTDNREQLSEYDRPEPYFGPAPQAVVNGLARFPQRIELHVISCTRRAMPAPERLAERVYFHQPVVPTAGWGRTAFLGCAAAVRSAIRRIEPQLVHAQGTERDCAVSMLAAPLRPKILTIHGCMSEMQRRGLIENRAYGRLVSTIERLAVRQADGVFCNSSYTEGLIGPRARRSWRVPNAVRQRFLDPPVPPGRGNQSPTLINIGLLSPYKRQRDVLRVVLGLRQDGHEVRVLFAGPAKWNSDYGRQFRRELDQAGDVAEHVGYLDEEKLINLMDQVDGAVHFPAMETFGLVVAEALARGLKFFGAATGGVPDVVDGVPGAELYETEANLKEGIRTWLLAGAPRAERAPAIIRERYSEQAAAERHLQIYAECLGRQATGER